MRFVFALIGDCDSSAAFLRCKIRGYPETVASRSALDLIGFGILLAPGVEAEPKKVTHHSKDRALAIVVLLCLFDKAILLQNGLFLINCAAASVDLHDLRGTPIISVDIALD